MKRILPILILLLSGWFMEASTRYNFKCLDVKDGVPDNFIHEMVRDDYGFVWLISGQVLCRYDGYDFKRYDLPIPGSHAYYNLKEDRNGIIWLQSNDFFYWYDRERDILCEDCSKVIAYPGISEGLRFLDVDYNGNLWFSVDDKEIICQDEPDAFRPIMLPQDRILKCMESRDGQTYLLFDDGSVFKYNDTTDELEFLVSLPYSDQLYQRMYLDSDGFLWFYIPHSAEDNLLRLDEDSGTLKTVHDASGRTINYVTDVIDDHKGNIWISTDNTGIIIYEKLTGHCNGMTVNENGRYSLPSNHINCLYLDYQDIMWVGTSKKGVAYTCLNTIIFERSDYSGLDDISCVLEDTDGNIWCGTDGNGIMREHQSSGRRDFYRASSGDIPGDLIVCSFLDSKGRVWFGTFGSGVFYYENGRFIRIKHADPAKDECMKDIRCINEDIYGNIWIGTIAYGLYCYEADGTFTDYTAENSVLYSNGITDLYCQGGRSLYVATSGGLFLMDTFNRKMSEISAFLPEHTASQDFFITSLYKDSRGHLWIGSVDGIYIFNEKNGATAHLDRSSGLSHDYIRGICEDDNGNIWLTTDVGVTNIIIVDDPLLPMPTFRCWRYYDEDGLDNIMFNPHSICCLDDGSVLMGGMGGLVRTEPVAKPPVSSWPHVEFTALYIANERVEVGEEIDGKVILKSNIQTTDRIVLDYSNNTFSITVSSLNYPVLHKNDLMYRLKGHTDWIRLEGNTISFNRLHPDTYELQVKVADIEGTESDIATLMIRIKPPILQSTAAYFVYAILLCLIVTVLVIRIRQKTKLKYKMRILDMNISRQREIDEAQMRFFTNISHDLRTPLSLIITPLERLMKRQGMDTHMKSELKHIHQNAESLMDAINQLLDFRKLDNGMSTLNLSYGSISDLLKEVCKSFKPYSSKTGIRLSLTLPEQDVKMSFDKDKMRRIFMNLLSNAYKFNSENGTISVSLTKVIINDSEMVQVTVADTGIGISDESKTRIFDRFYQETGLSDNIGSGIGLNIVKEFARLHGGTISVADNHPKGSVFTLTLPYEKELVQSETQTELEYSEEQPETGSDIPILIVEDNDNFRHFLAECLGERFSILEASNGKEALAILQKHPVKMVISDVMMPKMDGLELCRSIKNDIRFSHIPVILLTAKTADDNILQGLKEGSDDYITKPFNLDILLLRINKLLEWSQNNHVKFKTVDVSPSEITITSLDEQLISKAVRLVEENISDMDFSVDNLSSAVGMTRGHLYKKLMAITGKAPLDFIRTIRIKRGHQLLEKSQLGVADVAYRVGLSPKQFAKYFKEAYGILPSEFRKKATEDNSKIEIP